MDGPFLWYLNRGTGLVLMLLLTASALLGMWATRGDAGTRLPRFVVQGLHRNLALLGVVLTIVHVVSAVLDEYVEISWWQAFVPFSLDYEPLWLAMGIIATDLIIAVVVTSLVRNRIPRKVWLSVHLSAYVALAMSVAHGLGIGTDTGAGWARYVYLTCVATLIVASVVRLVGFRTRRLSLPRELDTVGATR